MKRVERLFKTLLGMSLAVSCTEYNEVMDLTTLPSETITIVASQEERKVETRTTLQSDGSVFWNPNDEISLFFNGGENGGNKFTSQNTETAEIAEFAGSIYGITGGGENLEGDAYFWAVYPYSENNSCDGTSIVTSLPSRQQAVEGSFNDDLFITVARSESVKMAFKNVCGGVKFCVKNSGIKSVTFCGNNNEKLAGEVRVAFDANNKPVVKEIIDGKSEITVDAPNNGTFEPGKYYYLITLPTELKSGFTMTFKKNDNTNIIYKRTSSVTINRSRFGVVSNLDTGTAVPDEEVAGGTESGFYLGIIGFNNEYFSYPIKHLSSKSINGYNSFIDGLSMTNGTLLYYAVDKSIDQLQAATFPSNLYDVSIVTFTDGLDRGSLDMSDNYLSNTEYLTALNTRLTEETVSNQDITSYTIGVRGADVTNYTSFQNNLKKLATSSDNVFEVTNMSEVNEMFLKIADLLGEIRYSQKFMLEIKGPSHNEKCRFTFDNVSSYSASKCYIEGTFNRLDKSLTNVRYVGLTSTSGTVVNSVKNAQNFYVYTFEGLQGPNEELVPTEYVRHWYTEEGVWQKDSEFTFDPGTVSMEKIKRSAAILLNLDCSSSLGDKFVTLQTTAKSFIAKLLENSIDPYEVTSVSLNKTNLSMIEGETETLKATVLPDTALQKDVEWSSTNSAVATVNQNGVVTARAAGSASIIAKTKDGGLTAVCYVSVVCLVKEIILDCSTLRIYNGESYTLQASVLPLDASDKTIKWGSSNTSVATVDGKGNITPVRAGQTTITAAANDESKIKATCTVTVLQHVESITISHESIKLAVGQTQQISATIKPSNASNKDIEWSSSDKTVVSVSPTGIISAIKKGTAQVSATTKDGEKIATCNIEVTQPVFAINLNNTFADLYVDNTIQLSATVTPDDANDKSITWNSSNSEIAAVDLNGLVKAIAPGKATITATTNDGSCLTAKCSITVKQQVFSITLNNASANLYIDETIQLSATIEPSNATNKSIDWSSSDSSVAIVDQDGLVKAISTGSAIITATTKDGSNKFSKCNIIVSPLPQSPIHLSLAVKKNEERYFIPQSTYQNMDLSDYTREGVTIISESNSFVLSLDIVSNMLFTFSEAIKNKNYSLPTIEQAELIVSNWSTINTAISIYNGTPMGEKHYWTNHTVSYTTGVTPNPTPVVPVFPSVPTLIVKNYYYSSAGVLYVTNDADKLCYAREIVSNL